MKRSLSIATILGVLLIALVGCTQPGYLEVENDTGAAVVVDPYGRVEEEIPDGDSETWTWDLSASPLGVEEIDVEVDVRGWYKLSETLTETIRPGETATIALDADAGLFILENDGPYTITTLGIATSSSAAEGRDDDTVASGSSTSWTLGAGSRWYFYINDGYWYNTLYWDAVAGDQITLTWYGETWTATGAQLAGASTANALLDPTSPRTQIDSSPVVGAQRAIVE